MFLIWKYLVVFISKKIETQAFLPSCMKKAIRDLNYYGIITLPTSINHTRFIPLSLIQPAAFLFSTSVKAT
jgi:hypothetical protein